MEAKEIIHDLCPPMLWRLAKHIKGNLSESAVPGEIIFTGDYQSWEEAEKASTTYAAPVILARTKAALLKVRDGEAAFERDSVTFDTMQHEFPLLAGLMRATASNGGKLSVLDFGGALGSTYFQCRKYLSILSDLRWSVVDQPAQVACGQADFANEHLHFYQTIDECLRAEKPNVLLLSSVLQYLPEPYLFLEEVVRHQFSYIIVERTAFTLGDHNRLTVQHVSPSIYRASYPAWFLSEDAFRKPFSESYELVCEYLAEEKFHPDGEPAAFKGFQFQRKPSDRTT